MGFFGKLAEMKPDMCKGHALLAQLIASGEIEVGLTAWQSNVQPLKTRGAPIDWAPVEPMIARPQGTAWRARRRTRMPRSCSPTSCSLRRLSRCLPRWAAGRSVAPSRARRVR